MRILITGGAGYLGSKLTETLLSQGHKMKLKADKILSLIHISEPTRPY